MRPEYIVFRYSRKYKTSPKYYISPYLILTSGKLIKKSKALPMKRLTKRRINLLATAEESLYPTLWGNLKLETEKTREDRFQKLYEILRQYTRVEEDEGLSIIYYHEVYSRSV